MVIARLVELVRVRNQVEEQIVASRPGTQLDLVPGIAVYAKADAIVACRFQRKTGSELVAFVACIVHRGRQYEPSRLD